jgi:hypothetical protein
MQRCGGQMGWSKTPDTGDACSSVRASLAPARQSIEYAEETPDHGGPVAGELDDGRASRPGRPSALSLKLKAVEQRYEQLELTGLRSNRPPLLDGPDITVTSDRAQTYTPGCRRHFT